MNGLPRLEAVPVRSPWRHLPRIVIESTNSVKLVINGAVDVSGERD